MKQENIILDKAFSFFVRIVKLYKYLKDEKKEYILSKQLLRCGTSKVANSGCSTNFPAIGANINEAQAGQSTNDFIAKMSIASKEARETKYWIDLLIATDYLNVSDKHTKSLVNETEEIIKLLTSIIKTSQRKK